MGICGYLYRSRPDKLEEFSAELSVEDGEPDSYVDFDKAWHAVHFMLTGSASATDSPLSIILGLETQIGDDTQRLVPPDAVRKFRDALNQISDGDLRKRYDPSMMAHEKIYLSDFFIEGGDEALDYVMDSIPSLRRFADRAANAGEAIVVELS